VSSTSCSTSIAARPWQTAETSEPSPAYDHYAPGPTAAVAWSGTDAPMAASAAPGGPPRDGARARRAGASGASRRRTAPGWSPATSSDSAWAAQLLGSSQERPLQRDSRARRRLRDGSSCFGAVGTVSLGIPLREGSAVSSASSGTHQ
jgi:hypothetical protein